MPLPGSFCFLQCITMQATNCKLSADAALAEEDMQFFSCKYYDARASSRQQRSSDRLEEQSCRCSIRPCFALSTTFVFVQNGS